MFEFVLPLILVFVLPKMESSLRVFIIVKGLETWSCFGVEFILLKQFTLLKQRDL